MSEGMLSVSLKNIESGDDERFFIISLNEVTTVAAQAINNNIKEIFHHHLHFSLCARKYLFIFRFLATLKNIKIEN